MKNPATCRNGQGANSCGVGSPQQPGDKKNAFLQHLRTEGFLFSPTAGVPIARDIRSDGGGVNMPYVRPVFGLLGLITLFRDTQGRLYVRFGKRGLHRLFW